MTTAGTLGPTAEPSARATSPKAGGLTFGHVVATLLGGTLIAFGSGLAVTIFLPGYDGLDEAFFGGLTLAAVWPVANLWILFAPNARRAWLRGLLPAVVLIGVSAAGLLL